MGGLILGIFNAPRCFFGLWQIIFKSFWARLCMKSSLQLEEALCRRARQRTATVIPPSPHSRLYNPSVQTSSLRDLLHYTCGLQCHSGMDLCQRGPPSPDTFGGAGEGPAQGWAEFPSEEACNRCSPDAPRAPAGIYCKPAKVNQPAAFYFG